MKRIIDYLIEVVGYRIAKHGFTYDFVTSDANSITIETKMRPWLKWLSSWSK